MGSLKGVEFNIPTDVGGFEQEMYLCRWLEDNLPTGQKKMGAILKSIYPKCPSFMQRGFFKKSMSCSNPLGYVKKAISRGKDIAFAMEKIIERGEHGMIFNGEVLHGVTIKANKKWLADKDGKWALDQEEDISKELIKQWMITHRFKEWGGRIVLFSNFGFSGVPVNAEWKIPDDDWEKLKEIWKKEDSEKATREIEKLMAQIND